jgi:hypothetical protein
VGEAVRGLVRRTTNPKVGSVQGIDVDALLPNGRVGPCLVPIKFCKNFQILRHIESLTHA